MELSIKDNLLANVARSLEKNEYEKIIQIYKILDYTLSDIIIFVNKIPTNKAREVFLTFFNKHDVCIVSLITYAEKMSLELLATVLKFEEASALTYLDMYAAIENCVKYTKYEHILLLNNTLVKNYSNREYLKLKSIIENRQFDELKNTNFNNIDFVCGRNGDYNKELSLLAIACRTNNITIIEYIIKKLEDLRFTALIIVINELSTSYVELIIHLFDKDKSDYDNYTDKQKILKACLVRSDEKILQVVTKFLE